MRSTLVLVGAAAAVVALAPAASAQTATPVPTGAGYVVTAKTPKAVSTLVRVPKLTCTKTAVYSVATGVSGQIVTGSKRTQWRLQVVAACHHGAASYKLASTDSVHLRLHAGDRVRLVKSGPNDVEVENVTTGEGEGGGTGAPGPRPTFARTTFFGTTVTGAAPAGVTVTVPQAHINGVPIGRIAHRAQRQTVGAHTVAVAGKLGPTGAFTVSVSRK